jgi:hypothetical protein
MHLIHANVHRRRQGWVIWFLSSKLQDFTYQLMNINEKISQRAASARRLPISSVSHPPAHNHHELMVSLLVNRGCYFMACAHATNAPLHMGSPGTQVPSLWT